MPRADIPRSLLGLPGVSGRVRCGPWAGPGAASGVNGDAPSGWWPCPGAEVESPSMDPNLPYPLGREPRPPPPTKYYVSRSDMPRRLGPQGVLDLNERYGYVARMSRTTS